MVKARGVTLIEMLIVIVILGVLTAIAVPQFTNFYIRQSLDNQVGKAERFFRVARTEALRRNKVVYICPPSVSRVMQLSNGCQGTLDFNRLAWSTGMLAYADIDAKNGEYNRGEDVSLLTFRSDSDESNAIRVRMQNGGRSLVISNEGRLNLTEGSVSFVFSHAAADACQILQVWPHGQTQVACDGSIRACGC